MTPEIQAECFTLIHSLNKYIYYKFFFVIYINDDRFIIRMHCSCHLHTGRNNSKGKDDLSI